MITLPQGFPCTLTNSTGSTICGISAGATMNFGILDITSTETFYSKYAEAAFNAIAAGSLVAADINTATIAPYLAAQAFGNTRALVSAGGGSSTDIAVFGQIVINSLCAPIGQAFSINANGTSAVTVTGSGVATSSPLTTPQMIVGSLGYSALNALETLSSPQSTYVQNIIRNPSTASTASADFIVNNDQSTDTTFYGDYGMNSSAFVGTGALNAAGNVYLTATSTDLAIGTTTANSIHFVVNSGTSDAMLISNNGVVTFYGNVIGAVNYQGQWNAATNIPAIPAAASTNEGWYYVVSTAGSTMIGTHATWNVGDWLVSNGTSWDFVTNSFTGSTSGTLILNSRLDNTGIITGTDYFIAYNGTNGITYNLPAATGSGRCLKFSHVGSVNTNVIIDASLNGGTLHNDTGMTLIKTDPTDLLVIEVCDIGIGTWEVG